jgi:hypothetical protein
MDREEIKRFLESDEARKLYSLPWMLSWDNYQYRQEDFNEAELRILVCFLSTGRVRATSSTYTILDRYVRELNNRYGFKIFIDYSYFAVSDFDLMKKNKVPFWFGNQSNFPAKDYDVLFVSHSVLFETINIFHALRSCEIPLFHKDRLLDDRYPLIMYGGNCSSEIDALGGNTGIFDLGYMGFGDGRLPDIIKDIYETRFNIKRNKAKLIPMLLAKYDNLYHPNAYTVEYDDKNKYLIKNIENKFSFLPEAIEHHIDHDIESHAGYERRIPPPDGMNINTHDVKISQGCTGGGSCTFCTEGYSGGGWKEISVDKLKKIFKDSIRYSAAKMFLPRSYNLNYYSKFIDFLYEGSKVFSRATMINMRADILAERSDYIDAVNAIEALKFSMPIEGISDRVRNKILNKSLYTDQIYKAIENAVRFSPMEIKIGLIYTGYEDEEDIKEGVRDFMMIDKIMRDNNCSAPVRVNVTPLLHYHGTGVRHLRQIASEDNRDNKFVWSGFSDILPKKRFSWKFNSRNARTYVQQQIINTGRLGTGLLDYLSKLGYHSTNMSGEKIVKDIEWYFQSMGINANDFLKEKDEDHIFPTSMFEKRNNDYIKTVCKDIGKRNVKPCIHTIVNKNPKCSDCGYCESKEEKKQMLKRDFKNNRIVSDIISSKFHNKMRFAYRVGMFVRSKVQNINKASLSYQTGARLLQMSDRYLEEFYDIHNISTLKMSNSGQPDRFYGAVFFDMGFKSRIDPISIYELNERLSDVNVTSFSLVDIKKTVSDKIGVASVVYLKKVSVHKLKEMLSVMGNKIKQGKQGNLPSEAATVVDAIPKIKPVYFLKKVDGGSLIGIYHSIRNNPFSIIASILRCSIKKAVSISRARILNYFGSEIGMCQCGEIVKTSEMNIGELRECPFCIIKKFMGQHTFI